MKKESTIFKNPLIREIIEKKWQTIGPKVKLFLLVPYALFLFVVMFFIISGYYDLRTKGENPVYSLI